MQLHNVAPRSTETVESGVFWRSLWGFCRAAEETPSGQKVLNQQQFAPEQNRNKRNIMLCALLRFCRGILGASLLKSEQKHCEYLAEVKNFPAGL